MGKTHWGRERFGWMLLPSAWLFVVLSCCSALMFLEQFHCEVYVHHHLECIFCPRKNREMWQGRMIFTYCEIRKGEFNADLLKCLWWWHYHPCSSVLLRFVMSLVPDWVSILSPQQQGCFSARFGQVMAIVKFHRPIWVLRTVTFLCGKIFGDQWRFC